MAQLCRHEDEIEALNTEVLLVSFSQDDEEAQDWQEYVCPQHILLLNPDRSLYREYDLRRSYLRSWSWQTLRGYIRLLRSGYKWRGIQGDTAQLGGDFIIDSQGTLRFLHRSKDPTDRPSVEKLLAQLHQLADNARNRKDIST